MASAMRQIYSDYHLPILPDEMTLLDIHFFYDPMIDGLVEMQINERKMKLQNKGK